MEYIPFLALIISIISIGLQYLGKIKSEKLKINNELNLQRYKDLKKLHSEISVIQKNIDRVKEKMPKECKGKDLNVLITELRKLEQLFKINNFLLNKTSIEKIEKLLSKLSEYYSPKKVEQNYLQSIYDFSSEFIKIINKVLFDLIHFK